MQQQNSNVTKPLKVQFNKETHIYRGDLNIESLKKYIESAFNKKKLPEQYTLVYKDEEEDQITVSCNEDLEAFLETQLTHKIQIIQTPTSSSEDEQKQEKPQEQQQNQEQQNIFEELKNIIPELQKSFCGGKQGWGQKGQGKGCPWKKEGGQGHPFKQAMQDMKKEWKKNMQQHQQEEGGKPETTRHQGVCCDGCEQNPIIGSRFKCKVCPDFDYCQKCHKDVQHAHDFKEITESYSNCKPFFQQMFQQFQNQAQESTQERPQNTQEKPQESSEKPQESTQKPQEPEVKTQTTQELPKKEEVVVISDVNEKGEEEVVQVVYQEKEQKQEKKEEVQKTLKKQYGPVIKAKAAKVAEILGGQANDYLAICEEYSKDTVDYVVDQLLEFPDLVTVFSSYKQ